MKEVKGVPDNGHDEVGFTIGAEDPFAVLASEIPMKTTYECPAYNRIMFDTRSYRSRFQYHAEFVAFRRFDGAQHGELLRELRLDRNTLLELRIGAENDTSGIEDACGIRHQLDELEYIGKVTKLSHIGGRSLGILPGDHVCYGDIRSNFADSTSHITP